MKFRNTECKAMTIIASSSKDLDIMLESFDNIVDVQFSTHNDGGHHFFCALVLYKEEN